MLEGKIIGFAGFGSIGQTTAKLAKAFGMKVLALRRNPQADDDIADETLGLDQKLELFARSDVVRMLTVTCAKLFARDCLLDDLIPVGMRVVS